MFSYKTCSVVAGYDGTKNFLFVIPIKPLAKFVMAGTNNHSFLSTGLVDVPALHVCNAAETNGVENILIYLHYTNYTLC